MSIAEFIFRIKSVKSMAYQRELGHTFDWPQVDVFRLCCDRTYFVGSFGFEAGEHCPHKSEKVGRQRTKL